MSSKVTAVLMIMLVVCVGLCYVGGRARLSAVKKETEQVVDECRDWEMRIQDLKDQVDEAQTEEYIERIAREKLGLVKPGETLYIVSEPDSSGFTPVARRKNGPAEIGD
ncbi:MAG: septum formation initiator family protein [Firmicutes bacterium]|jgi:cell division protein FtsL|nr:septum formation initiator family protein [Bacillota bacterium]MDD4337449.1 septum formation initiator family protein [Bacillota bacterium]